MNVIKYGPVIPVAATEGGTPICPCGCGDPMVETTPGRWACPVAQHALEQARPALDALIASLQERL